MSSTTFARHLQKKSDFYFVEFWKDGSRPLDWYAHWSHLRIVLQNVKVLYHYQVVERALGAKEDEHIQFFKPSEGDGTLFWDSPTADEGKAQVEIYRQQRAVFLNEQFVVPRKAKTILIDADFSIERARSINFIKDGGDAGGTVRSTAGHISIQTCDEPTMGTIHLVDEEDEKWSDRSAAGTIEVSVYMPRDRVAELLSVIKGAPDRSTFRASLAVLTFQSEVERSLAEPFHHQTYSFEQGKFSPVALESLTIEQPVASDIVPAASDEELDSRSGASEVENAPASPPPVVVQSDIGRAVRGPLWLIVILGGLHLLVTLVR